MVYYASLSFEGRSYAGLLDALFEEAGGDSDRARACRGGGRQVEDRGALCPLGKPEAAVRGELQPGGGAPEGRSACRLFEALHDLRERREFKGGEIALPARQTGIYEMF